MKATCIWKVYLPFEFIYKEDISDIKTIIINGVPLHPHSNKDNIFNVIIAEVETDIPDDLHPTKTGEALPHQLLHELYNKNVYQVGVSLQKFADAFSRMTDDTVYSLFDGNDLIVKYKMTFKEPGILDASYDPHIPRFSLNKDLLSKIIEDANKTEHTITENVKEMIRYSDYFYEIGNFEMCIINLSMAAEAFITSLLYKKGIMKHDHNFKECYIEIFEKEYKISIYKTSFTQKYYDFGLSKACGIKLVEKSSDWHNSIQWIYSLRNTIAHGEKLCTNKFIKQFDVKHINMYDILWALRNQLIDVINWVNELE